MQIRVTLLRTGKARCIAICLAAAAVCLASAGWIHIKALAAQILIGHAWDRLQRGEAAIPTIYEEN